MNERGEGEVERQIGETVGEDAVITFGMLAHDFRDVAARELTAQERTFIDRVLSQPFYARDAWLRQVPYLRVVSECAHCPSVVFTVAEPVEPIHKPDGKLAVGDPPYSVEGRDTDGIPMNFFLLASRGVISEIDGGRGDSGPLQDWEGWANGTLIHEDVMANRSKP